MEIASFVVAILAVLAAGASALYARGANARADAANRTAEAALDLQARIDEREREYRGVSWRASHDETGFALTNDGLTDAIQVTLVLRNFQGSDLHRIENIAAGETVTVESVAAAAWMSENSLSRPLSPPYLVHWSSPLGVAEARTMPPRTMFLLPDEIED